MVQGSDPGQGSHLVNPQRIRDFLSVEENVVSLTEELNSEILTRVFMFQMLIHYPQQ